MSVDELSRKSRDLIKAIDEVLAENHTILGATPEERTLTREAIRGLTPEQLRRAADREREYQKLHRHLDKGRQLSEDDRDPTKPDRSTLRTLLETHREAHT